MVDIKAPYLEKKEINEHQTYTNHVKVILNIKVKLF